MAASAESSKSELRTETESRALICDSCDTYIRPPSRLFHCRCEPGGFDLCLPCALNKPEAATSHAGLEACMLDARDTRRTFIPGPSIDEFRSIIASAKEVPQVKVPRRYSQFFQQSGIDGISFEDEDQASGLTSVTTKAIENDYTVYQPLDPAKKEIRIVYLPPGSPDDPLELCLHAVPYPWNDVHVWVALSYTWGSMDETRRILLGHSRCKSFVGSKDGEDMTSTSIRLFSCTANLEAALREIRKREEGIFLWIDAICINQGDLQERGDQVTMMAEIYSHAAQVCIWLGPDPETALAVKHVTSLSLFLQRHKKGKDNPNGFEFEYRILERMVQELGSDHPLASSKLAPHVTKLVSNPWFVRAWVVQEVWAAKSIIVLCGEGRGMQWETLMQAHMYARAYATVSRSRDGLADSPKQAAPNGEYSIVRAGQDIWGRLVRDTDGATESTPIPAIELLDLVTRRLKASDKRDLIFATLGMGTETADAVHHSSLVTPDYAKPAWQVYSDFTRWYIAHHRSLDILGYVTYAKRGLHADLGGPLPSWSISPEPELVWSRDGTLSNRTPYQADANTPLDASLIGSTPGDCSLVTRGYEMDSVAWVDERFFSNVLTVEGLRNLAPFPWRMTLRAEMEPAECGLKWLWQMVRKRRSVGECTAQTDDDPQTPCRCQQVFDEMLEAVSGGRWLRTGLRNRMGVPPLAEIGYIQFDKTKVYGLFASQWAATTGDPEMKQFCARLRDVLLPLVDDTEQDGFGDRGVMEASYRLCLFVTTGGAMGVCPPQARVGDPVVVLFGCRMPVILTKRGYTVVEEKAGGQTGEEASENTVGSSSSPWEFVGECYVNGLMDGETTKNKRDNGALVQTFELC